MDSFMLIIIRSKRVHCTVEEPISLSFPILVKINLQHSQAQPFGICTCVIYLTKTYLYVEHHTENQLVPFLKSLVWLGGLEQNLPNSKWTLYHYTIDKGKNVSDQKHTGINAFSIARKVSTARKLLSFSVTPDPKVSINRTGSLSIAPTRNCTHFFKI